MFVLNILGIDIKLSFKFSKNKQCLQAVPFNMYPLGPLHLIKSISYYLLFVFVAAVLIKMQNLHSKV